MQPRARSTPRGPSTVMPGPSQRMRDTGVRSATGSPSASRDTRVPSPSATCRFWPPSVVAT
jgi:hypothetical protein